MLGTDQSAEGVSFFTSQSITDKDPPLTLSSDANLLASAGWTGQRRYDPELSLSLSLSLSLILSLFLHVSSPPLLTSILPPLPLRLTHTRVRAANECPAAARQTAGQCRRRKQAKPEARVCVCVCVCVCVWHGAVRKRAR